MINNSAELNMNTVHHLITPNVFFHPCRREQAVEKKYPGTYKRHLVRPIVRSNAVEKLIKKKGSMSHKPGMPTAKRSESKQLEKPIVKAKTVSAATYPLEFSGYGISLEM